MVRSLAFDAGLVGSGPLDRMDRCCLLDLPCSLVLLDFRLRLRFLVFNFVPYIYMGSRRVWIFLDRRR